MKHAKIFLIFTCVIFFGFLILWKTNHTQITEKKALKIIQEANEKLTKMDGMLWTDGLPLLKMGKAYYLFENCDYHKTTDTDITTIAQIKEETEKILTKEFAQKQFYRSYLDIDYPFYVEQDGILYEANFLQGMPLSGEFQDAEITEITSKKILANMSFLYGNGEIQKAEIEILKIDGKWFVNSFDQNIQLSN